MPQVQDPVCGMMIDSTKAAGSSTWNGTTYFFCSAECQRKFNSDPDAYASGEKREPMAESEPRWTKTGPIVAPKFGSAGSGGAEYEPGPDQRP